MHRKTHYCLCKLGINVYRCVDGYIYMNSFARIYLYYLMNYINDYNELRII